MVHTVIIDVPKDNFLFWMGEHISFLRRFFVRCGIKQELKRLRQKKLTKGVDDEHTNRIHRYEQIVYALKRTRSRVAELTWNRGYTDNYKVVVEVTS